MPIKITHATETAIVIFEDKTVGPMSYEEAITIAVKQAIENPGKSVTINRVNTTILMEPESAKTID